MKILLAALMLFNYASAEKMSKEKLKQLKEQHRWSFEIDEEPKQFPLGLKKNLMAKKGKLDKRFLKAELKIPGKFSMAEKWGPMSGIHDQGPCGSCVMYSVVKNFTDSLIIRGVLAPWLSTQQLMNCGTGYQCNGYWFTGAAQDLKKMGGLVSDDDYPYTARAANCKASSGKVWGPIQGYSLIDNSHKSISTAVFSGYPVSSTIGADNPFMAYKSGVYNACSNQSTNHQVLIEGWDCEDQVDAAGNCIFDSTGRVAAGKGYWLLVNSWSIKWGEQGVMRIKMSQPGNNKSLCNNHTEEVGVLETGLPVPQPAPTPDPTPVPPPAPPSGDTLPVWVWVLCGVGFFLILFLVKKVNGDTVEKNVRM